MIKLHQDLANYFITKNNIYIESDSESESESEEEDATF
jgi:hypothetical protein